MSQKMIQLQKQNRKKIPDFASSFSKTYIFITINVMAEEAFEVFDMRLTLNYRLAIHA